MRINDLEDYAIALCRAIEYHCSGKKIPARIAKLCPHHANKLNVILALQKEQNGNA